ncbi:MAG: hypothetical protein U9P79_08355 [Candidatus Cloacimonadota bacterium]|nr:hypothetical protein [Thermodesulfobacteriota bacterium]MEA2104634.1 hypothetical protein [Candidatus Cloacimonadota bacterium]
MKDPIPDFVDHVLNEWDFIAFFAYDNFELSGRGVVGIVEDEEGTQAMYGTRDFFMNKGDQQVLSLLDTYDPETEYLVYFDANGGTRTIRVRTPEGGRHPKRIWFFEMLRRASEAPEQLPDILPDWFIQACEKLEQMKNEKAEQQDPG